MPGNDRTYIVNTSSPLSPDFSSAEAQRLYYLKQLGVFSCYPRFILPGALPSEACVLPDAAAIEPAIQPAIPSESHAVSQRFAPPAAEAAVVNKAAGILSRALEIDIRDSRTPGLLSEPPKPMARPERKSDSAQEQTAASAELQFQMLLLQADNGVVICNQIPMLARQGLSEKEQRLLHNILLWLGCTLQPQTVQRRFTWPLPGLGVGTRKLAGKSLNGFLEQAQQELKYSSLVLMGSSSLECLEEFRADQSSQNPAWQQYTTHSLSEVLALPELKRSVWQQLLPLHARLSGQAP